jgi:nitrite reductase/ring-hydroxylating ferredoxin subunit
MPNERIRVASVQDFKKKRAVKFTFGKSSEGFVIEANGGFHAYENLCRHMALPLDYGDGEFLTQDGKRILCRNHGAEYDPSTGRCVHGPCADRSLKSFGVVIDRGEVWVEIESGE